MQAANIILDRGWGKPTTQIDIEVSAKPLQQYTTEELDRMIAAMPDDEEAAVEGQLVAPMGSGDTLPEPRD